MWPKLATKATSSAVDKFEKKKKKKSGLLNDGASETWNKKTRR